LGGPKFKANVEVLQRAKKLAPELFPSKQGPIRKIVSFPDKEGKMRVIAILDYFSQTVLRKLHGYLYSVLKHIPQDMTFDQGAFKDRISN
jgi:hypothetical protein